MPSIRRRFCTAAPEAPLPRLSSRATSIAWPSFQSSLHKARRADALVAVAQVQIAQERAYANRRRYAAMADLPFVAPGFKR